LSNPAAKPDDAGQAVEPVVVPAVPAEPLTAAVPPAEIVVPGAAAVAGTVPPAATLQRPASRASPASVAALLARGDALIAIGDVAAARLVYQRAATLDSARAATAAGQTYDPRFLQSIGAMGVVADPERAADWYRKGVALGDEDAAPLLSGLNAKASQ
jgi:TPR repeat protein